MTSPSRQPTTLPTESVSAAQDALGAEHAALWVYRLVSAFLPAEFDQAVQEGRTTHRTRRDALELLLSAAGQDPRAAEPAYVIPHEVTDQASAIAAVVLAETDVTVAWRAVLERTDDRTLRTDGLAGLTDAAVLATRWRMAGGQAPATPPLPGAPA